MNGDARRAERKASFYINHLKSVEIPVETESLVCDFYRCRDALLGSNVVTGR